MTSTLFSLQDAFEPARYEDWQALAEKTLGGKPLEKALMCTVSDGVRVPSLACERPESAGVVPGIKAGGWDICMPHWNKDAAGANTDILDDLEGGATSVALRMRAGLFPGLEPSDLGRALEGVYLDLAGVRLMSGEEFEACGKAYLALLAERGVARDDAKGCLGADPIGALAVNGRLLTDVDTALSRGAALAVRSQASYPSLQVFTADGSAVHQAGGDHAHELAFTLAVAVAYLRAMEQAGLGLDVAASLIEIRLNATSETLVTTAKFRAARLLWAEVLKACGLEGDNAGKTKFAAVMGLRMVSVKDPWVNILRATAAGFGAATGGADAVTLLPHDTLYGVPTAFARRVARNVQNILLEESWIGAVADPAAGSFQIESMTHALALAAWQGFQAIESAGGAVSYLTSGALANALNESWQARADQLAKRRIAVTGVSEFPDLNEKPIETSGISYHPQADLPPAGVEIARLPFLRDAEMFEAYRFASDAALAQQGARPTALLVTMGTQAQFTPRLSFAKNLLSAIGVDQQVVASDGDIASVLDDISHCVALVLCGEDASYEEVGESLVEKLSGLSGARIFVAGRPANADALTAKSGGGTLYMGCNLIDIAKIIFGREGDDA